MIDLDGCTVFQQEVAVTLFLSGNRVDNYERQTAGQRLGRRQSARLGDNQVRDGHKLVNLVGVTQDLRPMLMRRDFF